MPTSKKASLELEVLASVAGFASWAEAKKQAQALDAALDKLSGGVVRFKQNASGLHKLTAGGKFVGGADAVAKIQAYTTAQQAAVSAAKQATAAAAGQAAAANQQSSANQQAAASAQSLAAFLAQLSTALGFPDWQAASADVNQFKASLEDAHKQGKITQDEYNRGQQVLAAMNQLNRRAAFSVMNLSQVFQDSAQFSLGMAQGVRAVANNIESLTQSLVMLAASAKEAGAEGGTLSILKNQMKGMGGVILWVSLISAGLQFAMQKLSGSAEEAKQAFDDLLDVQDNWLRFIVSGRSGLSRFSDELEAITKAAQQAGVIHRSALARGRGAPRSTPESRERVENLKTANEWLEAEIEKRKVIKTLEEELIALGREKRVEFLGEAELEKAQKKLREVGDELALINSARGAEISHQNTLAKLDEARAKAAQEHLRLAEADVFHAIREAEIEAEIAQSERERAVNAKLIRVSRIQGRIGLLWRLEAEKMLTKAQELRGEAIMERNARMERIGLAIAEKRLEKEEAITNLQTLQQRDRNLQQEMSLIQQETELVGAGISLENLRQRDRSMQQEMNLVRQQTELVEKQIEYQNLRGRSEGLDAQVQRLDWMIAREEDRRSSIALSLELRHRENIAAVRLRETLSWMTAGHGTQNRLLAERLVTNEVMLEVLNKQIDAAKDRLRLELGLTEMQGKQTEGIHLFQEAYDSFDGEGLLPIKRTGEAWQLLIDTVGGGLRELPEMTDEMLNQVEDKHQTVFGRISGIIANYGEDITSVSTSTARVLGSLSDIFETSFKDFVERRTAALVASGMAEKDATAKAQQEGMKRFNAYKRLATAEAVIGTLAAGVGAMADTKAPIWVRLAALAAALTAGYAQVRKIRSTQPGGGGGSGGGVGGFSIPSAPSITGSLSNVSEIGGAAGEAGINIGSAIAPRGSGRGIGVSGTFVVHGRDLVAVVQREVAAQRQMGVRTAAFSG